MTLDQLASLAAHNVRSELQSIAAGHRAGQLLWTLVDVLSASGERGRSVATWLLQCERADPTPMPAVDPRISSGLRAIADEAASADFAVGWARILEGTGQAERAIDVLRTACARFHDRLAVRSEAVKALVRAKRDEEALQLVCHGSASPQERQLLAIALARKDTVKAAEIFADLVHCEEPAIADAAKLNAVTFLLAVGQHAAVAGSGDAAPRRAPSHAVRDRHDEWESVTARERRCRATDHAALPGDQTGTSRHIPLVRSEASTL